MIVDRYDPINLFELVPKLKLEMDPELAHLDRLLDDDVLFERVKADLCRRYPNSARLGRHSTPVEVILRMLVVKRLYNFSYEQTQRFVNDSIVLRQFCRLYLEAAPDDSTLIRWANLIGPKTLEHLNERAVELARSLKVSRGRKLRTDATVIQDLQDGTSAHTASTGHLPGGLREVGRSRKSPHKASREGAKYAPRGALRRQDLRRASPFRGAPRAGGLADLPEGAQRRAGPAHREAGFHL